MDNQKKKIEPVFVIGVILFLFALGLYAYNGYLNRKALRESNQSSAEVSTDPYASSTAESSAAASSTSMTNSGTTSVSVNSPAQVTVPTQTSSSSSQSDAPLCDASQLDGSVSWQGGDGTLTATAKITNHGSANCELSGFPQITLFSGSSQLGTTETSSGGSNSIVVQPSSSALLHFTWSNWCGTSNLNPIQAKVSFGSANGYLLIPIIGANGAPQSNSPLCQSTSQDSNISVSSY